MRRNEIFRILLAVAIIAAIGITAVQTAMAAGENNQLVEFAYGTKERVYPIITTPNGNECGSDGTDIVLQYNTWWGPKISPDNVKWSSDLWWVRDTLRLAYQNGLSANGLKTTTTRVCVGWAGQRLPRGDLSLVYLWHT